MYNKFIHVPSGKNPYTNLLRETIEAQKEIKEGKGERFETIDELVTELYKKNFENLPSRLSARKMMDDRYSRIEI